MLPMRGTIEALAARLQRVSVPRSWTPHEIAGGCGAVVNLLNDPAERLAILEKSQWGQIHTFDTFAAGRGPVRGTFEP
jgi:hypothetical protein